MPRRLPSGRWQGSVWLPPRPDGTRRRATATFALKSQAKAWEDDLKCQIRTGDWIAPEKSGVTVGELWAKVRPSRQLELASRRRDDSHWRRHVAPKWAHVPIGEIGHLDVEAWVAEMRRDGIGATTIEGALGVLRAITRRAVKLGHIRADPAADVKAPRRPAHQDRVLDDDESERLLAAVERTTPAACPACGRMHHPVDGLIPAHRSAGKPCAGTGEPAPERADGRLFLELLLYLGLRWEEAAAIKREAVLLRDGLVQIGPVVERDGTIRPYPKSPAGERLVPIPEHLLPRLRERALATPPGGLLITTPEGRVLDYSRWYHRVWSPALTGLPERPAQRGRAHRAAIPGAELDDPQPTPHDLRHTYGTSLAEGGVPPHEIMALMGHETLASVERYLHARESRFERAREVIRQRRSHSGHASNVRHERSAPCRTVPDDADKNAGQER